MRLHFHNTHQCEICYETFILLFPLGYLFWNPALARQAVAEYDLEVSEHELDHCNERIQEVLNAETVD